MRQVNDVVEDSELEREQRRRRNDVTEDDADGEQASKELRDSVSSLIEGLISRFAYKTSLSSSRPPPAVNPPPSRPVRVVRKDPPNPQLVQLSKCIGCGLKWTSRKTAKQKHTHIEQCAKKNALSKDTIKILIEKEIAISPPTQATTSSRIPANGPGENTTDTLMNSVIPTGPVRKLKRHQIVPTVRSLPETRESILDRARDILGPIEGKADPQPTQQFGQSALAHRNTQHPKRPALLGTNRPMEEPPLTQSFGASSLRGGIVTSERSVNGREEYFGVSMFAQDSVLSSDHHKRPASPPPPVPSEFRTVRRRLLG